MSHAPDAHSTSAASSQVTAWYHGLYFFSQSYAALSLTTSTRNGMRGFLSAAPLGALGRTRMKGMSAGRTGRDERKLDTSWRKLQTCPTYASSPVFGMVYTCTKGCTNDITISSKSLRAATAGATMLNGAPRICCHDVKPGGSSWPAAACQHSQACTLPSTSVTAIGSSA